MIYAHLRDFDDLKKISISKILYLTKSNNLPKIKII